jgi:hypothetical protein
VGKALVEVQALTVKPADEPADEEIPEDEYAELLEPGVLERYTEAACKVKGVVGGEDKTVVKLSTLIAAGAQLDLLPNGRPVAGSLMLTGEAGRGKNYLCDAAVSLLPEEWYEAFEAASATVFYYLVELKPDYLKHKFVYPNEAEAIDTVVEFLRPMLSQGRAKKLTVNKNGDGTNVAQELIVEGPVTGVIPTVRNKLDDQLQTRMLVAELEGYDGRIKAHTAALSKLLSPNRPESFDTGVRPRWKAALGSLTGVRRVVIDFADRDEFRLSNEDVSHGARLWQNVLGLMCTHAWLEQRNREIRELADGTSAVVATAEDYKAAYEIFKAACKRSVVNLSDTHRQIVEAVYELRNEATFDKDGFSTKQVADKAGVAKSTVSKNRAYLVMSVGLLYETEDKRLNISKDAEPSWWAAGDAMMGFPSPETVKAWEGYTPSEPEKQGNGETVGQKPHTYAAEPVSQAGKPQETQETVEEMEDQKPHTNGEYSENGQGNGKGNTPTGTGDADPLGEVDTDEVAHNTITGERGKRETRGFIRLADCERPPGPTLTLEEEEHYREVLRERRREQRKAERAEAIRINSPDRLHDMDEDERERLRAWIRENVAPRKVTEPKSSYGLKHVAEKMLGFYVGNGELKGAMLEAGYEPVWDNRINMGFRCGPRPRSTWGNERRMNARERRGLGTAPFAPGIPMFAGTGEFRLRPHRTMTDRGRTGVIWSPAV